MTIYIFFFHHTTCTCNTLASSATNQGDNTVSVAQGGTATPGATEQLLPPDRVFERNTCLCIHKILIYICACVCVQNDSRILAEYCKYK